VVNPLEMIGNDLELIPFIKGFIGPFLILGMVFHRIPSNAAIGTWPAVLALAPTKLGGQSSLCGLGKTNATKYNQKKT